MDSSTLRRSLACTTVAAGLGLSWINAEAVVYRSVFDPPNFRGTATFDVSQACLDVGTGSAVPGIGGCTVGWLGATVTFQEAPGLTFDYTAFLPDSDAVDTIWVEDGELAGLSSDAIGAVVISGHANPLFNGPWWIQYAFSPPDDDLVRVLDGPPSSGQFGLGVVYLYSGVCTTPDVAASCIRNQDPSEVADVEFFRRVVPEPGTLVLTLAALGGAWLARRRRTIAG